MSISLRKYLLDTQETLLGMPLLFSLAEAAKTFLDNGGISSNTSSNNYLSDVSNASIDENDRLEASLKPLNHQVGNPLIMEGTRCTENVFLAWRETFLERRAKQRAEAAEIRAREQGSGPTGKEMFLQGLLKNEAALADPAEIEAIERGAAVLASVDASLFTGDIPSDDE